MNNKIEKNNKFKGFMKKHRVALIICASILTVIVPLVTIFAFLIGNLVYTLTSSIIQDKNGTENFSVVTITDEEIQNAVGSDYFSFSAFESHDGNKSEVDDFGIADVDYDQTKYSSMSTSGILIANATKTDADSMNLKITSTVDSGNAEIFVFIDDELYDEVAINCTDELYLDGVSGKTVYVKAACESASISIEVQREVLES